MAIISGHGATLGFGTTTGFTPKFTSIGGFDATRESLDTSYLLTTGARTKIGGDLFDVGSFSAPFFFEPDQTETTEDCCFDDLIYASGAAKGSETVTITYPTALATDPTVSGSAHVTGVAIEDLATDTLLVGSITLQWNDWPAFNNGAA